MSILTILNEVGATSSKTEKQAILERNKDNELLQKVFSAAYDETTKFYVKAIPEYTPLSMVGNDGRNLDAAISSLFLNLATRKVTGDAARTHLQSLLNQLSADDATVLARIVQRDLRIGCSESTANKVWSDLIPEYPYMRCALPDKAKIQLWKWKDGIISQLKCDGQFLNLDIFSDGNVMMTSRSGSEHDTDNFPEIVAAAKKMFPTGWRVNGELLCYRNGVLMPREESNGMVNSMLKGGKLEPGYSVKYVVWDMIPLTNAIPGGKYDVGYKDRLAKLQECLKDSDNTAIELVETKIVYSLEEAYAHYFEMVGRGLEGTVIKTLEGVWKDTTSNDQAKLKVVFEVDLEIMGFVAGNGKNESTFGSITVATKDRLLYVNVSGFKDKKDPKEPHIPTRQEIWDQREQLIGTIMAVKANGIMVPKAHGDKYSLFSPRFAEFRLDKSEADTNVKVREQFEAVVSAKKKK